MSDDKFRKPGDAASRLNDLRTGKGASAATAEPSSEKALEGDREAFSAVSADQTQKMMVVLRFKNGTAKAISYSYLFDIDIDPSNAIVMDFIRSEVRIEGRNLWPLFSGLSAHRIAKVEEIDDLHAEARGGNGKNCSDEDHSRKERGLKAVRRFNTSMSSLVGGDLASGSRGKPKTAATHKFFSAKITCRTGRVKCRRKEFGGPF